MKRIFAALILCAATAGPSFAAEATGDDADAPCFEDMCSLCAKVGAEATIRACTALIEDAKTSDDYREEAYAERSDAYGRLKQYDKQIADLDQALALLDKLPPDKGVVMSFKENAHLRRGIAHYKAGHNEKAIADLRQSASDYPDGALPDLVAMSYYHLGQFDAALSVMDRVIGDNGMNSEADHYCRGLIRMAKGDTRGAIEDFDKAVEELRKDIESYSDPDDTRLLAKVLYQRGLARQKAGDAAGGQADIAEAQKLDPTFADPAY